MTGCIDTRQVPFSVPNPARVQFGLGASSWVDRTFLQVTTNEHEQEARDQGLH